MERAHLRVATHVDMPHHALHATAPGRDLSISLNGIAEFGKDVGGVFKGIGEGAVDTVTGLVEVATDPIGAAQGVIELGKNPKEALPTIWNAITDPIVEDWNDGNQGEAIGRGIFGAVEVVFGGKGLTKIGKFAKKVPNPPSAKLVKELFGSLDGALGDFARRVRLEHIFKGDLDGGLHHVAAPGRHGDFDVAAKGRYHPGKTWDANVTMPDGTIKKSVMFPREWTRTEVLEAIRQAELRIQDSGGWVDSTSVVGREVGSATHRGITIRIVRDKETGEIITASPSQKNQTFTEAGG
jgi:hypothetical protein